MFHNAVEKHWELLCRENISRCRINGRGYPAVIFLLEYQILQLLFGEKI